MHTPGPWGIERTSGHNWIGPMRRKPSRKVAEIVCHTDREGLTDSAMFRNDANAQVIAEAPEMLALIIEAIDADDKGPREWEDWNNRAKAIVERATLKP